MEAVETAPSLEHFTALSDHEAQTPGTFFGGEPVLHLHAPSATIKAPSDQVNAQPDLLRLAGGTAPAAAENGSVSIADIDVWVTSRNLLLYSKPRSVGLQIPYQTITVTAQDAQDVLLELNLSDNNTADEDIQFVQLRIVASEVQHHLPAVEDGAAAGTNGTTSHNDSATALFKAISDCQELNPDPPGMGDDEDDTAGAFDETAPGATGWITSENMADFMDADGNFRMPGGTVLVGDEEDEETEQQALGAGAGRTRTAAEVADDDEHDDAAPDGEDESKWQRTG